MFINIPKCSMHNYFDGDVFTGIVKDSVTKYKQEIIHLLAGCSPARLAACEAATAIVF